MELFLRKTQSQFVKTNKDNQNNQEKFHDQKSQLGRFNEIRQKDIILNDSESNLNRIDNLEKMVRSNQLDYRKSHTLVDNRSKLSASIKQAISKRSRLSTKFHAGVQLLNIDPLGKSVLSKLKKTCGICLGMVDDTRIVYLCKCKHFYCKSCVNDFVMYKIKMFERIQCPQESCEEAIDFNRSFYKNLSQEKKQKYMKIHNFYGTSSDPTLKMCPKQNCNGVIKLLQNSPRICDTCRKEFCSKCNFQKHQGRCEQKQIQFFQENLGFRQCSNCKIIVQKIEGCNHMTCKCKHEFCYLCGHKWQGPGHFCNEVPMPPQIQPENDLVRIFDEGGLCGGCSCVAGSNGNQTLKTIIRVVCTIGYCLFIMLLLLLLFFKILGFTIATILIGLFGYSFQQVRYHFEQENYCVMVEFIIKFPILMFVCMFMALFEMMPPFVASQCTAFGRFVARGWRQVWQ